ncbi:MAG: hypothetical protein WEA34_14235 [Gemmatimonadota bacterium]
MGRNRMRAIGWLCMVALVGCGSSGPLAPIVTEEVSITLAVSGGLIGQSYEFLVDGETSEVVGVRCEAHCDFEAGEVIVPVSEAQVADLARRLEAAGVFESAGDYEVECCDQIGYDLRYRRGDRTARVQGTDQTIPQELATAIGHVATLSRGRVPVLVSPETELTDWPRDAYTLGSVEADGTTLRAEVSYGGGCRPHRMDLVTYGGWLESEPVQINALITHDDGNDPCDAFLTEERIFDLSPLARAWVEAYGPASGPIHINLRLWDPASGSPVGRLLELEF